MPSNIQLPRAMHSSEQPRALWSRRPPRHRSRTTRATQRTTRATEWSPRRRSWRQGTHTHRRRPRTTEIRRWWTHTSGRTSKWHVGASGTSRAWSATHRRRRRRSPRQSPESWTSWWASKPSYSTSSGRRSASPSAKRRHATKFLFGLLSIVLLRHSRPSLLLVRSTLLRWVTTYSALRRRREILRRGFLLQT